MDNSNQDKSPSEVQFNSENISENRSKRENDVKFQTRLTFKDKLKKFGNSPLMKGPRKFLWLAGILVVIAGIVIGIIAIVNANKGSEFEEGSDEWFSELDNEILDGFESDDLDGTISKLNTAIANAKAKDDKDLVRQLYNDKSYIYTNSLRYDDAIALYKEMLEYFGNDGGLYRALADNQRYAGDIDSAIESYKNAIKYLEDDIERRVTTSILETLEKQQANE